MTIVTLPSADLDVLWRDLDRRLTAARRREADLGTLWRSSANENLDEQLDALAHEFLTLACAFAETPAATPFARQVKAALIIAAHDGGTYRGFLDPQFGHRLIERWNPATRAWQRC